MRKKVLLMVASLSVLALSGCGASTAAPAASNTTTPQTITATAAVTTAAKKGITLDSGTYEVCQAWRMIDDTQGALQGVSDSDGSPIAVYAFESDDAGRFAVGVCQSPTEYTPPQQLYHRTDDVLPDYRNAAVTEKIVFEEETGQPLFSQEQAAQMLSYLTAAEQGKNALPIAAYDPAREPVGYVCVYYAAYPAYQYVGICQYAEDGRLGLSFYGAGNEEYLGDVSAVMILPQEV